MNDESFKFASYTGKHVELCTAEILKQAQGLFSINADSKRAIQAQCENIQSAFQMNAVREILPDDGDVIFAATKGGGTCKCQYSQGSFFLISDPFFIVDVVAWRTLI